MAEFDRTQRELAAARRAQAAARRARFVAGEKLRKLERQRDELGRRRSDANEAALAELESAAKEQRAALEKLRAEELGAAGTLAEHFALFEQFSDPTENASRLADRYPILLFPLRIETRFKQVTDDDVQRDQLWVRVYPDDIAVDTFEEVLAEVEIGNARIYWTNVWKAGGDDGEKRAAWQSLVKSHGAGRAFWIIEQFAPTNAADEPVRAEGEHLLIVVTDTPLPAAEKPAVRDYWRRVFLARNDQDAIDAAFADLVAALGQARADAVAADYAPQNLAAPIPGDAAATIRVEFLELPDQATIDSQQLPWMNAANTALLPERFVVLGFDGTEQTLVHIGRPVPPGLAIGPNPTAAADEQLRLEDGELVVPDELAWMTDFDAAVQNGMGFRINLDAAQARAGFDRLFVLGLRLGADVSTSTADLEQLIRNHQRSRKGFSLLPQGAPTNNVEDEVSGYTWRADTDESYDHFFTQDPADDPADWRLKKDGRWLAEQLGIAPEILKASPNYYSTDQCEARAMNAALWPATLGYFMEQMMEPVFADGNIRSTREYFNRYVLGRGAIPAIRVGKQPYGILPATPFSRMAWLDRRVLADDRVDTGVPNQFSYLPRLYGLIRTADETWSALADEVSFVGKPGVDPHQALLDVVGLHPSSVEFYQRYAETFEQLYNRFKLSGAGAAFIAAIVALGYLVTGTQLLRDLGHDTTEKDDVPEILNKLFLQAANLLKGPVVDDVPLSETAAVRAYRPDGTNYLEWLASAARDSHDTLRRQAGFIDDRPPTALLYLMLQHALDLGYVTTGIELHVEAELMTRAQAQSARREPKFLHIQDAADDKGSPWQYLYKAEAAITGDPQLSIARFIPQILVTRNPYLNTQIEAISHLEGVPTARLERAFAEHIDLCTNRLDAWWLGLLNVQLGLMRAPPPAGPSSEEGVIVVEEPADDGDGRDAGATRGTHLGAYGWVEDLRPDNKAFEPVKLPGELQPIFNKPGQAPLGGDRQNFGYVHAPSLDHAVTAAVLRNGYRANATPANPDTLAINLTSERVRLAMGIVEGMRNGQSLAALLGYQLERSLHDSEGLFLDSIVFELRREFPLAANRFSNTRAPAGTSIQSVEARNVVDGLKLLEHVQAQPASQQGYPFGLGSRLPVVTDTNELAAIDAAVRRIMNINDAVADLAMAEGVYQVVRGNYDRAAGTLEAYAKGNFPPVPEVVQTPRSGVTLTHRVGIHLEANLSPDDAGNTTPRSKGEPAINAWLAGKLPPMASIFCQVDYFDHAADTTRTVEVTAADLGLLPIDLLYTLNRDGDQELKALDDRIIRHIVTTQAPRPDADIRIRYRDKQPGKFSFFETSPLLGDLRALLLGSRPLKATDTRLPNEAQAPEEDTAAIRPVKLIRVRDLLEARRVLLEQFVTNIDLLLGDADEEIVASNAIANVDGLIDGYAAIADEMSRFGLPGAGLGFAWDWRRRAFGDLAEALATRIAAWTGRLAEFDQKITDFATLDPGLSNAERIDYLLQAALLISTDVILPPVSGDPQDLLDTFSISTRPAFDAALTDLAGILPAATEVGGLYTAIESRAATVALHDAEALDVAGNRSAIVAFAKTLQSKATSLNNDVSGRVAAADALIVPEPADSPAERIEAMTEAMRKLTSADFVVLPEFSLGADHAVEWQTAFDDRAQLLDYLTNDAGVDFPIDDWLYGVARVREKLHHVESATMFTEALSGAGVALTPLQFPYRSDDAWLAMQYPATKPGTTDEPFVIDEDKLLYTAHYATPFDSTVALHCGVLVDEWTEVIPTTEETTGLAFHYDRPNTEPPQTLLLALPADFTGSWDWQDLVDTLHETLDLARKRAVEPRHVDDTAYAPFLPAVISSVTRRPLFTMLNYAFNNAVQFTASEDS